MTLNILIKIQSGDAVIRNAAGDELPSGPLTIDVGETLEIVSPTGGEWRAMICNEAAAGAVDVWAELRDDAGEPWDLHTLKPHGAWRTGWSVVLEADAGDSGRVYVPVNVETEGPATLALPPAVTAN